MKTMVNGVSLVINCIKSSTEIKKYNDGDIFISAVVTTLRYLIGSQSKHY